MVRLRLNGSVGEMFAYDLSSLIKAFYPQEKILLDREDQKDEGLFLSLWEEKDSVRILLGVGEKTEREKTQSFPLTEWEGGEWKKAYRREIKRTLYEVLREYTGKSLPWGTLTGVRPTKIMVGNLEEGMTEEEACAWMENEYFCSTEKIQSALTIAKKEIKLLSGIEYEKEWSVYLGIPFCPTTCLYCSFTSYPIGAYEKQVGEYLACLTHEMQEGNKLLGEKKITTLYVGGGTPTTLSPSQLEFLLKNIRATFDFSHMREFTVEAGRPDSITREKLELLLEYGVTRISINPQTMKQETLDLIGRHHRVEDTVEAFHLAREVGHNNINMDLIIGLPGECAKDVENSMKIVCDLAPDSITVHTLALKRASALTREIEKYRELQPKDTLEMLKITKAYARKFGYEPYYLYRQKNMAENLENIGYAKPGKEGLYNILIMEEKQSIFACGAGASSKFVYPKENRIERIENVKSIQDYLNRIDEMIARKQQEM